MSTYLSSSKGEHFATARQDLVTMLKDFQEQMEADMIRPNVTQVLDNHNSRGTALPYLSVGLTNVSQMDYLSRTTVFEINLMIEMQIWLHVAPLDGQYDERLKWDLINSLFNYLKDSSTISTNFDRLTLRGVQGNVAFGLTNTQGAIFDLTVEKAALT